MRWFLGFRASVQSGGRAPPPNRSRIESRPSRGKQHPPDQADKTGHEPVGGQRQRSVPSSSVEPANDVTPRSIAAPDRACPREAMLPMVPAARSLGRSPADGGLQYKTVIHLVRGTASITRDGRCAIHFGKTRKPSSGGCVGSSPCVASCRVWMPRWHEPVVLSPKLVRRRFWAPLIPCAFRADRQIGLRQLVAAGVLDGALRPGPRLVAVNRPETEPQIVGVTQRTAANRRWLFVSI